jgi:spermidine/putrescine transport system substrate-binding protein
MGSEAFGLANAIHGSEKFLPPGFATTPEIALPAAAPPAQLVPPPCPKAVRDQYDAIWAELTE